MPRAQALSVTDPVPAPPASRRWRLLHARVGHLLRELGKFGTVGAVAFTLDTVVYAWLLTRFETITAKTLATVASATVAFLGNRFWTWRHRSRSRLHREYALYFLLNLVGLAITLAVLGTSHYGLGRLWPHIFQTNLADIVVGSGIGTAMGTMFRFWSYRRFVFTAPKSPQVTPSPADPR